MRVIYRQYVALHNVPVYLHPHSVPHTPLVRYYLGPQSQCFQITSFKYLDPQTLIDQSKHHFPSTWAFGINTIFRNHAPQ